jgi:hypothetical protein
MLISLRTSSTKPISVEYREGVFHQTNKVVKEQPLHREHVQTVQILDTGGFLVQLMKKHYKGDHPLYWGMQLYRLICLHYRGNQSLVYLKKSLRKAREEIYAATHEIYKMPVRWEVPWWAFVKVAGLPKPLNNEALSWLSKEVNSRPFINLVPSMVDKNNMPVYWNDALLTKEPVKVGKPLSEAGVWGKSRLTSVVEVDGEKRGLLVWFPYMR